MADIVVILEVNGTVLPNLEPGEFENINMTPDTPRYFREKISLPGVPERLQGYKVGDAINSLAQRVINAIDQNTAEFIVNHAAELPHSGVETQFGTVTGVLVNGDNPDLTTLDDLIDNYFRTGFVSVDTLVRISKS